MDCSTLAFIILITSICCISANKQPSLTKNHQTLYPHIVQYIDQFSLTADDLQRLLNNQYRGIFIADIVTADYEVHQSTISISYDGSSRKVEKISPLKVKVINDSFSLKTQFQVTAIHRIGSKNYTCSTKIPQILVNYTKAVDFETGNTIISDLTSSYSSSSFEEPSCGTVSKNDSTAVMNAVNSTKGGSLYLELKKIFDRMQDYLSANANYQRLSRVYDQNPYVYDFYGFKMNVQVNTIQANPFSDNGIENSISGIITGSSFPAIQPPQHQQGFTTFYSFQFIKGAIEYAANNYGSWREIKLNSNNMRTSSFKWRVIDFQFIIPAVLAKHPQSYLNDVEILCSLEEVTGTQLMEKQLKVGINWRCSGSFEGEDKRKVTFLSFLVGFTHSVDFSLQEQSLSVRVAKLQMNSLQFDYIGQYELIDPFTAAQLIKEGLFQFQTYTFGTFFKVRSKQLKMKIIPNRGIWIA